MSKSSYRFNLIYQTIVATSLGISTLSANAVSLSQASVNSAQHEPLSATIEVKDIDAKNFQASLATGNVYQQMGLKQDADIQVKFTPTSDNAGKITLTSKTPISKPFTDVVLNLNNNGEQVVEPQTLLMPVASNTDIPTTLTEPIMVATEQEQNLPVAGDMSNNTASDNTNGEAVVALDLASGDPIELSPLEEANLQAEKNLTVKPLDEDKATAPIDMGTDIHTSSIADAKQDTPPASSDFINTDSNGQAITTPKIISQQEQVLSAITPDGTNQQINILTEQITRKVLDSQEAIEAGAVAEQATNQVANTNTPKNKTNGKDKKEPSVTAQTGENITYVVQSGDSLWNIASQIAKANNLSVMEVMTTIHQQNPDAFFNNNISRLKTNASLNLPNYSVVPSQKAIQEATQANRQTHDSKTNKANHQGADKKAQSKKSNTSQQPKQNQMAQERPKSSKPPAKPLPKAQLTLVSPGNVGQATGTQAKSNGGKGNNNQLVNTLKNTRSQTAASATKVNSLNQELASATQKLQLQNQKLAELEARLKALKDK